MTDTPAPEGEEGLVPDPAMIVADLTLKLKVAELQRDFLVRQADSLIQRIAGAHVAQGLIALDAAQGFVLKEAMPINQGLASIIQASQPDAPAGG